MPERPPASPTRGRAQGRFRGTPDWERLLANASMLQAKIPGAVLVGGTAAALHAGHRFSFDHDHVILDLARTYEAAIASLESIVGWRTRRRVRGKLVLGHIDGIDAGLRNQQRSAPLETTTLQLPRGQKLEIPTIEEMLRIKAFLIVRRNATRDYLDVAALCGHLGLVASCRALEKLNSVYAEFAGEGGTLMSTLLVKLANPDPFDLTDVDLGEYKGIVPPWNDWNTVVQQSRALAVALLQEPADES